MSPHHSPSSSWSTPAAGVLLQQRDEHARPAANQWGLVGGHVEDGRGLRHRCYRELLEETGIEIGRRPGAVGTILGVPRALRSGRRVPALGDGHGPDRRRHRCRRGPRDRLRRPGRRSAARLSRVGHGALPAAFLDSDLYRQLADGSRVTAAHAWCRSLPMGRRTWSSTTGSSGPAPRTAASSGSTRTAPVRPGRAAPAAARSGIELFADGPAPGRPTPTRGLLAIEHRTTGVIERLVTEVDGHRMRVLQQRRRRRQRRHLVLRLQHRPPDRAVEGRLRREHPHRPAAVPSRRRDRSRCTLDGLAFANGVALPRTSPSCAWPRRRAAPSYATVADRRAGRCARPARGRPARLPRQHRARAATA